jgi:hypothetical protein
MPIPAGAAGLVGLLPDRFRFSDGTPGPSERSLRRVVGIQLAPPQLLEKGGKLLIDPGIRRLGASCL